MRKSIAFASVAAGAVLIAAVVSVGVAQTPKKVEQKVTPPEARYFMGVTTGGGMMAMAGMAQGGRPSMGDMMKMGMNGMPTEGHMVELKIGSTLSPTKGAAEAEHTMPAGAQVNKPIFLRSPEPGKPGEPGQPGTYQQPKGQITFYWGCGEKAGPGQPVVLTFDKLMSGQNDAEIKQLQGAVGANEVGKPTASNSRTFGEWPNNDDKKNRGLKATFPAGSTVAGPHSIASNYAPKIDFTLGAEKSYMGAVRYSETKPMPSGAIKVTWDQVSRATGYSLGVMAPEKMGDDSANIIMWSSANRPATFIQMADLTPAEVSRLINLKAVLPAATTTCTVPAEVAKATKEGSMLMFTAFGDEQTFIYPERPADVNVTWDQEWFTRVLFKSARMDMISPQGVTDMGAMMAGATPEMTDAQYCAQLAANKRPSTAEIIGGATGIPGGGLIGRALGNRNKKAEPVDPRCAK